MEVALDYYPSRAAINRDADTWVQIDPSYKQYEYQQGFDVAAIPGIDAEQLAQSFTNSGTVNEAEGWVQGLDPAVIENAQQQAQTALIDYVSNNMTDPTVGDVIGGRKTIVKERPTIPSSLPNRIVTVGACYAELPDKLRNFMSFAFGKDVLGELMSPVKFPWARLNNERITLSFKPASEADEAALQTLLPEGQITDISQLPTSIPAYLIYVIPELKINGEIVKSGTAMSLGEELDFVFQVQTPLETQVPYTYKVIAGSYLAIASIGQNVGLQKLNALQASIENTKTILESQDQTQIAALTREDILGDLFYTGVLGYFAQYTALAHMIALQQRAGHSLAIGYGSFGYEPYVDYFFGTPRSIQPGGAIFNIRVGDYIATHTMNHQAKIQLHQQMGLLSSALEHAIPEQMFVTPDNPGEAISAVKALAKATQQGQRIYRITPENQSSTLPNIHHNQLVMDEIRAALAVGKEVTTHTDAVSVPGWTGAGYIIMNPATGIGAYKIGGGMNGGGMFNVIAIVVVGAIALFMGGLLFIEGAVILGPIIIALAIKSLIAFIDRLDRIDSEKEFNDYSIFVFIKLVALLFPFIEALGATGAPLMILLESFLIEFEETWF